MLGVMGLAQEKVPQAKFLCFNFELLDDGNNGVPSFGSFGNLVQGYLLSGQNFFLLIATVSMDTSERLKGLYFDKFNQFGKGFFAKRRELVFNLPQRHVSLVSSIARMRTDHSP